MDTRSQNNEPSADTCGPSNPIALEGIYWLHRSSR